jgi:2-oxo-4-hydroxy-4-carboxy-5-ureidoimidazoline decarboxylase
VAGRTALERFNTLPDPEAEGELLACCASAAWARRVSRRRPYPDFRALVDEADAALADLPWAEVAAALSAHPRIGEHALSAGRDAAWSRREQAGMADADDGARLALVEANREYEDRFGHVFLIFASGRSAPEMLAAARERLTNDDATERTVVRGELGKITRLRLERLIS